MRLHFLVADNQHIRNLFHLCLADLVSECFIGFFDFYTDIRFRHSVCNSLCIFQILFSYRDNLNLYRSNPGRESAGIMFNQDADETFKRAVSCTMQHDSTMFVSIFTDIIDVESFRKLHIHLDRAALPCSSKGILYMEIQLRSIECTVAFIDLIRNAGNFDSFTKCICRNFPKFITAH